MGRLMKRLGFNVASSPLTFAVGLCLYALPGFVKGEPYGRTLVFIDEGRGFRFAGTWETVRETTIYD